MTQKARVLRMLKEAGDEGVRSDAFYKAYLPRAGARIWELRQEGHEITSEQERQFVRYVLRDGLCACGCESPVQPGKRFVKGHQSRKSHLEYLEDPLTGCWVWQRGKSTCGYGMTHIDGAQVYAHRVYYEKFIGPIPDGLQIDHLCRNRACVNPDHLEPVSNRENSLRGIGVAARNFRKTHCAEGHPYDEENTYVTPNGWRQCRICRKEAQHKLKKKRADRAA